MQQDSRSSNVRFEKARMHRTAAVTKTITKTAVEDRKSKTMRTRQQVVERLGEGVGAAAAQAEGHTREAPLHPHCYHHHLHVLPLLRRAHTGVRLIYRELEGQSKSLPMRAAALQPHRHHHLHILPVLSCSRHQQRSTAAAGRGSWRHSVLLRGACEAAASLQASRRIQYKSTSLSK